jgi:RNA polymerase sigma factor (sigma-70 family)
MNSAAKAAPAPALSSHDKVLVERCLLGSEEAWSALIEKYKNLIFSIPIKYGLSTEDATEIFQSVSVTLLQDLPKLREPQALAAWLIKVTARKCLRWKRDQRVFRDSEIDHERLVESFNLPDELLQQIEQEQIMREALLRLSPECNTLIELLFFSNPPLHYDKAAEAMGLAKGSIGATRMRCLEKLRRYLEKKGFTP